MRRTWIKLYVDQCLRGSMISELTAEQRWMWIGLLLLAGDSSIPGLIFRRKDANGLPVGYSEITLAETLDIDPDVFRDGIQRMVAKDKITVEKDCITILNWNKYQSEYQRQKPYRADGYKKNSNDSDALEGDIDRDIERDNTPGQTDPPKEGQFDRAFEGFWKLYPRKIHKQDARGKFIRLARKGEVDNVMAGLKGYLHYLKQKSVDERRSYEDMLPYVMHPSTFLTKERYKDYIGIVYKSRL